ncbi:MAG: hypothetical protein IJ504_06020 [Bacteroidales bacterium]|nr:hypothetical protein [Bacteroidales bacterium]
MKKINIISILLAALAFASSCNRDEAGLNPPEQGDRTVTITAAPAQTKTAFDGGAVKWEDGDAISLVFTHPVAGCAVHQFSTALDASSVSADFTGKLPLEVYREDSGYLETVLAVYPETALAGGVVDFTLPAEQKVRENGTFADGLNLASASVSLADIRDDGNSQATFRNALSILRFTVQDDVTSVTLTGTSPLAGKAPLSFVTEEGDDLGRLVLEGDWGENEKSTSVTLKPADGNECFPGGEVNMLVWPGEHTSMSVTVNYKEYGEFRKSKTSDFAFLPSRYYTLDLNADSETLVSEISGDLDNLEDDLSDLEARLEALETTAEKISAILDQIQSVALLTEYLDNAVYAPYGVGIYDRKIKEKVVLDYKVRPAKAMELLLDVCAEEGNLSDALSAKIDYKDGNLGDLTVSDAVLEGDVLTVTVDAADIYDNFYAGGTPASMALEISDGNTAILSDFANLVPKEHLVLRVADNSNIPAMRGANMSFEIELGLTSPTAPLTATVEDVKGFSSTPSVSVNQYNGHIYLSFKEDDDPSEMSFKVVLSDGNETDTVEFTFEDAGELIIDYTPMVDYVGGTAFVNPVLPQNGYAYKSPSMSIGNNDKYIWYHDPLNKYDDAYYSHYIWASESGYGEFSVEPNESLIVQEKNPEYKEGEDQEGVPEFLDVEVNTGTEQRSFHVDITVVTATAPTYTYTKRVTITQKENGAPIDESMYYQDSDVVTLQEADQKYDTPLNVVIVSEGYQKKDLVKGGVFARNARSACDAFFGVEPYKSFRDRFNVYLMAFESEDEGISLQGGEQKDTYFKAYYQAVGNTYVNLPGGNYDAVRDVLRNDERFNDDAEYYRTIVIMLINTDADIGSNARFDSQILDSPLYGEMYCSMGLTMVPAKNMYLGNLVRHEAGGHSFGRLADEYEDKSYDKLDSGDNHHAQGWYRNVTIDKQAWNWDDFIDLPGYEDIGYYMPSGSNFWCPTETSIMKSNSGTFNAVCRQIIYERIIKQTEGYNAYSWDEFLEYDKRNIN